MLTRHGLGYIWRDEQHAVELHYDRLRRDRDGLVHAQVVAVSTLNGHSGLLCEPSHVGVEQPTSRSAFLKALAATTPDTGIEWASIFSQANHAIVAAFLEGDPPVLLRDVEPPEGGEEILPPLVVTRRPTIIFGPPGVGKSELALDLAASIHSGRDMGLGLTPSARVNMLIVDSEDDPFPWKQRLARRWPAGEVLPDIHYVRIAGSLRQNVERLQRYRADLNIGGAVFDSGGAMCGGVPEEAAAALDTANAIRELDLLVNILTLHVNRAGDTTQPFGAQAWNAMAGNTWYAAKEQEPGEDTLTVTLINRKPAQNRRLERPLAFRYTFGPDRTELQRLDSRSVDSLSTSLSITDQISKVLRSGERSIEEIRLALPHIKANTLDTVISRACKRNVVVPAERINKGKRERVFRLPARQAPDREASVSVPIPSARPVIDLLDDDDYERLRLRHD